MGDSGEVGAGLDIAKVSIMKDIPVKLLRYSSPKNSDDEDRPIVDPPSSMQVEYGRKPVIYLPDGRVLVRRAGF